MRQVWRCFESLCIVDVDDNDGNEHLFHLGGEKDMCKVLVWCLHVRLRVVRPLVMYGNSNGVSFSEDPPAAGYDPGRPTHYFLLSTFQLGTFLSILLIIKTAFILSSCLRFTAAARVVEIVPAPSTSFLLSLKLL